MNDILNDLIKNCVWRNDAMGIPVCEAEIAPCAKIIESGECPALIKHFKSKEEDDG